MIEKCINKGMSIEEICALDSEQVIEKSEYFKYENMNLSYILVLALFTLSLH